MSYVNARPDPVPVCSESRLSDASGEPREVAVRRNQTKTMKAARVEQVHGIDDERRVGGILACGVAELLHWLDCHFVQHFFPAFEVRRGPVAVGPLYACCAIARHLGKEFMNDGCLGVVGINKNCQLVVVL